MADEIDSEASQSEPTTTADVALSAALDEARVNEALTPTVAAFFEAQTDLARDQRHHRAAQFNLEQWSRRLKLLLQVMTICVGAGIVSAVGYMAWQAHEDYSLTIAEIGAPQDFAPAGLTGKALAGQLQDKLAHMQRETVATAAAARLRSGEERDIRVAIPETGISLGEVQSLMRGWLSHETAVVAYLSRTPSGPAGLSINLRVGDEPGEQISRSDGNVDALLQKAAEQVYETVEPERYAQWLDQHGRTDEAIVLLRRLSRQGNAPDRSMQLFRLKILLQGQEPIDTLLALDREAVRLDPTNRYPLQELALDSPNGEARLDAARRADRLGTPRGNSSVTTPSGVAFVSPGKFTLDSMLGQFADAFPFACRVFSVAPCTDEAFRDAYLAAGKASNASIDTAAAIFPGQVSLIARMHDTAVAAQIIAAPHDPPQDRSSQFKAMVQSAWLDAAFTVAQMRQDWPAAADIAANVQAFARDWPNVFKPDDWQPRRALVLAHVGRFDEARTALASVPRDLYDSLVVQAQIAELSGEHQDADRLFRAAVDTAPSLPQSEANWGAALLARGDTDGAILKLTAAIKKAPHFADPIETWGEALAMKGDAGRAAPKYAEAAKYAPNWGRLHLKWAESLAKAGKTDEARAQKQTASRLELTAAERNELDGLRI